MKEYGYPVWQQAVNVYNDGQILLFIPVKNVQLEEIETIWTFKITNEQIRYYPVRKDRVGIEDSWSFDYFTQKVLNQTPKSGVRFEVKDNKPSTRGWVESIHCVQSFAGIEYDGQLVEVSTGWHCWSSMYYVQDVFVMYILDFSGYGSGEDHFYGGGSGGGGSTPPPVNTIKPKSDLPKKKPKDILEDCNDIIIALKNALKKNNDTFINFQSPYDDKLKFPSYSEYLAKIQSDPTREHSISLKYYPDNDEYITNAIQTGDTHDVTIITDNLTVANVHNHPNNMPPSPRDLRTMIKNVVEYPQYKALYTLTNDGTYYAFYVTNRNKAKTFWDKYKDEMIIDATNHFDEKTDFYDNWRNAIKRFEKLGSEDAWNYTLAYLMDKYDMGIGLFSQKKGENGFTSLHMKKDTDGIYQVVKCK